MKKTLDYSEYYLDAKQKLTEVHNLLNKKQYKEALDMLDEVVIDVRMTRTAVLTHID